MVQFPVHPHDGIDTFTKELRRINVLNDTNESIHRGQPNELLQLYGPDCRGRESQASVLDKQVNQYHLLFASDR